MSIRFQVLGRPGEDNAVLIEIDSGQTIERILFDCGEACLQERSLSEIRAIDHLCFSHLHMDHVGGFDTWFRANFDRDSKPNQIWGPPQTISILQHRFRGYLWNLHDQMQATWRVTEVAEDQIRTASFQLTEAFAVEHDHGCQRMERILFDGAGYEVQAVTMDHLTPVLAYIVREKPRQNIDTSRLKSMGLRPGPWLKQIKEQPNEASMISIDGNSFSIGELRQKLIIETAGDSFAYCTDFVFDSKCVAKLTEALAGVQVMICEAQYRADDLDLAKKHHHMITTQSASLAHQAQVGELILFHLSSRYTLSEWQQMLDEVRSVYPRARFPQEWSTWFENR